MTTPTPKNSPRHGDTLRRRAEEAFQKKAERIAENVESLSPRETRDLLHELQVHQIELEMQNEELRRTQEALDASRSRYFDLYDLAPVGYCTISEKGLILEANLTAATLWGVARGVLAKRPLSQFISPEDRDIFYRHHKLLFKTGISQAYEIRMLRQDGRTFWARVESTVSPDEEGASVCRTVISDVTERRRAEEALSKSELLFRELFNSMQEGFYLAEIIHDENGEPQDYIYLDINPAFAGMMGLSRDHIIGKRLKELAPDASSPWLDIFRKVALTGTPTHAEFFSKSFGRCFNAMVYRPFAGQLAVLVEDITERRQAEEALNRQSAQLEAANKELESFSYSVSHDLQAPLRAIDGYSRMILKQQGDKFDEQTKHQFTVIRDNTQRMGQLINDLLAFSRIGKQSLSVTPLNLDDLIRDVWEEIKTDNPHRPVELKIGSVPPGVGDRSLIRQVLINLLSNAVKFSRVREVPRIEVGACGAGGEHVYYVRDNGVGFDMRYYDKLFNVFQRLHSGEEYEGTGIGLALAQRIISRHGGRIWAEGEVDKGATFYFTLPARQE